jgi:hypothetical protein
MKNEIQVLKQKSNVDEVMSPKMVKIAYLILVHRLPNQFKRLFIAFYEVENYYLIHIDKKANAKIGQDLRAFLKPYPNVFILASEKVVLGGYSMVQAELDGMNYLLHMKADWDYFINLSGQDYLLKSRNFVKN